VTCVKGELHEGGRVARGCELRLPHLKVKRSVGLTTHHGRWRERASHTLGLTPPLVSAPPQGGGAPSLFGISTHLPTQLTNSPSL
jgi:hypothetical protein